MRRAQLGMAMFLISEAVFFFLLILAFVYFRAAGAAKLNLNTGAFDTACLLASSFTVWRSRRWIPVTIGLGAVFVVGQASEYWRLLHDTTFFTLAGVHELHVLIGVIALAVVPSAALRVMALYWTFFAFLWLAIFLVTYVWSAA